MAGSRTEFQDGQRVRVKRGQFAGKTGTVKDLLPNAVGVRIGRKIHWFARSGDLEPVMKSRRAD